MQTTLLSLLCPSSHLITSPPTIVTYSIAKALYSCNMIYTQIHTYKQTAKNVSLSLFKCFRGTHYGPCYLPALDLSSLLTMFFPHFIFSSREALLSSAGVVVTVGTLTLAA